MNNCHRKCSNIHIESQLPLGFRFKPTDEELVYFLEQKVSGNHSPSSFLVDAEVYNVEPWRLLGMTDEDGVDQKEQYYFTRTRKKNEAQKKTDRSAGDGSWKVTDGEKFILDSQERAIGLKRSLVYKCSRDKLKRGFKRKGKNWIMHEYRLSKEVGGWVICKIMKSNRSSVNKEKEEDVDDEISAVTATEVDTQDCETGNSTLNGWHSEGLGPWLTLPSDYEGISDQDFWKLVYESVKESP